MFKDGATFESAFDWLCLNFPSHELPFKFSCGASRFPNAGILLCELFVLH